MVVMFAIALALVGSSAFGGGDAPGSATMIPAAALGHGPVAAQPPLERPELVGHAPVNAWVEHYSVRDRRTFSMYLSRLGAYENLIADKIAVRGLPESLLYLPVIESALSATARSSANAVGLWQLRDATARELGLRVDEWVDERRDPVLATDAALDYLEQLYARFGSWELALVAYNAGPTRVASRIRWYAPEAHPDDAFQAIISRLPRETRNYLPKLMATRILAQSGAATFAHERAAEYLYEEVLVPPRTSLWRVAEAHGSTLVALRVLNPHLLKYSTPPGIAYPVRVPVGASAQVVASLRGLTLPSVEPTA